MDLKWLIWHFVLQTIEKFSNPSKKFKLALNLLSLQSSCLSCSFTIFCPCKILILFYLFVDIEYAVDKANKSFQYFSLSLIKMRTWLTTVNVFSKSTKFDLYSVWNTARRKHQEHYLLKFVVWTCPWHSKWTSLIFHCQWRRLAYNMLLNKSVSWGIQQKIKHSRLSNSHE